MYRGLGETLTNIQNVSVSRRPINKTNLHNKATDK